MKLVWSRRAKEDRDEIFDRAVEDNPDAAIRLDAKIKSLSEQIASFPMGGKVGRTGGTRELSLAGTSYIAVYEIEDETVVILKIAHGAQAR